MANKRNSRKTPWRRFTEDREGVSKIFPTMKPLEKQDAPKTEAAKAEASAIQPKVETIDVSKVEIEPLFKDYVDFETFSKSDFRAVKVKECTAVPKSKKLLKFVLDDGTETVPNFV